MAQSRKATGDKRAARARTFLFSEYPAHVPLKGPHLLGKG